MTSQQILQADLIDILFENRNKLYGAYQLRKSYPRELTRATVIAVGTVFLLVCFIKPSQNGTKGPKDDLGFVVVDQVALPKEKKPEPPKAPPPPKAEPVKQQTFIDQIVISNKADIEPLASQDILENAAVSDITSAGTDVSAFQPVVSTPTETKNEGGTPVKQQAPQEVIPDKQPQFPGGMEAWIRFLQLHLQAPQDLEPGEKKTVQVRFHVAEDGSITNFQVLQSAGMPFDNEVMRVLKKMPKWAPAIKAGQPVPVSFTQPVTFVGAEE